LTTLGDTVDGFESLFPTVADQKQTLLSFAGTITENNYIEKIEYLLTNSDQFSSAIQTILKAQKFIKKNFSKVREFKRFIEEVSGELKKADRTDSTIQEAQEEFDRLYKQDMVKNFGSLQQQVQIVKDNYYRLIKNAAAGMSHEYQLLSGKVDAALRALKDYQAKLNVQNQKKLDELKRYC
jgi:anion-transporting  ArsA/GET3 family ATPase